jgi:uncharacterized membrane protein HdeD (DUF308 family)
MFASNDELGQTSEGWGWYVALGIALVIVGLIALWNVVDATLVTTIVVGWLLVIGGFVEIFGAFTRRASLGNRILHVLLGILYLLVGFDLVFEPLAGTITLAIAVGILLIIDGVIRLWVGFTNDMPYRWLLFVVGVIDILLGIWIITNIPVSAVAIGLYVGIMLLMAGITWIMAGFSARPTAAATPA